MFYSIFYSSPSSTSTAKSNKKRKGLNRFIEMHFDKEGIGDECGPRVAHALRWYERFHEKKKKDVYHNANKQVAIICNHQCSVSKIHSEQISKLNEKIDELQADLKKLKIDLERDREKISQTSAKIKKMQHDMHTKEDLKTVALVACCKRHEVPIEKGGFGCSSCSYQLFLFPSNEGRFDGATNIAVSRLVFYEGERPRATDNNLLGSLSLSYLPGARRQPLDVCFSINENELDTITSDKERLSTIDIEKMIEEAERYSFDDKMFLMTPSL
ncbi:eukaryotic DNA topoisomerase I, catalytic core protein [Medicago truncatula]|uniref:Eukaryotic DNA topoisomerase I, catalytic core protein n=1 Tax=Medicago truncatula TaxID=3880 RepID=G7J5C4_MEDTR|nr:eukaryotic DNA topoisomerase I, catalytic core protein [Medicago truncatula]